MLNIWGFFMQTSVVFAISFVLMIVKVILKDKLSPRWQYMIWYVLFLALILPTKNGVFPIISAFIETCKFMIESQLSSHYIQYYEPIVNHFILPFIQSKPASFTDVLFFIYIIGFFGCMFKYLRDYFLLRKLIHNRQEANVEPNLMIQKVSVKYSLPKCKTVLIEQCSSAFVFGIFHPVLVLPSNDIDEKIILHELLHIKYKDSLQSVVWSFFRCLHWCNPFMHFVFNQISNDMESLCDQRVLELIEGEERREYGRILLAMTNEKYPHAFGTTSISNGGKQIKKRIETITRFKKYPQGMQFVSICIGILFIPLILGTHTQAKFISSSSNDPNNFIYQFSLASARQVKCTTLAGAIDMYAKAILTGNDYYLMSVMPNNQIKNYQAVFGDKPQDLLSGHYQIYNLTKINENEYQAYLMLVNVVIDEEAHLESIYFPIHMIKEDGWKAERTGNITQIATLFSNSEIKDEFPSKTIYKQMKTGQLTIQQQNYFVPANEKIDNGFPFFSTYSLEPIPNAKFEHVYSIYKMTYQNEILEEKNPYSISISYEKLADMEEIPDYYASGTSTNISGGSSNGTGYKCLNIDSKWDKEIVDTYIVDVMGNEDEIKEQIPKAMNVVIYINGQKIDEVKVDLGGY